jgi:lipopolysaccharide biosynthesis glycosyltransferase
LTFKILPKNIDKIISLDNDIFFNCDIADIYNIPMENNLAIGQID